MKNIVVKRLLAAGLVVLVLGGVVFAADKGGLFRGKDKMDKVITKMTMDEKISQMIIPAIRTWNEEKVTDLSAAPEVKAALQKHQYGGIILFGANITGNEQVTRLVYDLQENNKQITDVTNHIPYLMPIDEEGGIVIRLSAGTRMTGNMAIGATANAAANAEKTGDLLGEEIAAAGFNADYAPDIDVNNNPNNPVIGTRSFSDDPDKVAELGMAYAKGLSGHNIIATYKHFPGHGDTGTDSHIGLPSVEKTYEEISATELVPFKKAIEGGADMIMTAHITYPLIDEEVTYGDGVTKGYYPATMSKKMIQDILRTDLGFDGVVVTDALEMGAIATAGLVPGAENSVEYHVNIAEKVINAGVDILLLPVDITDAEKVAFYDDYIAGIAAKVKSGEISEKRIDESVKRILLMKEKYGIFRPDGDYGTPEDIEVKAAKSKEIIGSQAHHDAEMQMAREAITLIKNDGILPLSSDKKSIVVLARREDDKVAIGYALEDMKKKGYIGENTEVTLDFYFNSAADVKLNYTDEIKEKISTADVVICFSYASGSSALDKEDPQFIALHNALEDVHAGGGKYVLISENLPYDAAIYQEADGILLAYMGSGLGIDPTDRLNDTGSSAFNANIVAAIETAFGASSPQGKLPVNIPKVEKDSEGNLNFTSEFIYKRGEGISY
ncbi:glycoside hydrolase family 3 protein [Butyrivibrio sp. MC2021]|uniref:glycoside hydrolase family 3 protein n=1 Tax=Butyrivibrio sp. MC2021 TaxID=1408306 RepID=UPI0006865A3C|nr:glycoside hydrolase family 3 protein [Butyrivibrio sp. MC2021]